MKHKQHARVGKTRPKEVNNPNEMTDHHVPPRNPDKVPRIILRKKRVHHQAYHTLFAAAKSYEDCCAILLVNWWTDEQGNFIK
jgi:hypothetical protein